MQVWESDSVTGSASSTKGELHQSPVESTPSVACVSEGDCVCLIVCLCMRSDSYFCVYPVWTIDAKYAVCERSRYSQATRLHQSISLCTLVWEKGKSVIQRVIRNCIYCASVSPLSLSPSGETASSLTDQSFINFTCVNWWKYYPNEATADARPLGPVVSSNSSDCLHRL